MSLPPKNGLEKIKPVTHGGLNYAELEELGIRPESIIDFSTGINPLGAPPGLMEKLTAVSIETYPDSGARELTRALAENLKVQPDNILVGNGSSEVLWLCAAAYFSPGDRVVIIEPTFGEYETASLMAGSLPVKVVLKSPDFPLDTAEVIALARTNGAKGLFLCNPNNPTGTYISKR
ncbi:MAG: aminotransferase class I/II-fold pyridoxal phosphate-dependent enzyme, partial [Dehalococcoidia bacterium]|nr:aminotransferase class I/II-fold pyridoxal phosphate-dependent enzyme [Dehalococcoidia bacterium]